LYPEDWVKRLKEVNHGRRYMSGPAVAQAPSARPTAAAQKPAAPGNPQTANAGY